MNVNVGHNCTSALTCNRVASTALDRGPKRDPRERGFVGSAFVHKPFAASTNDLSSRSDRKGHSASIRAPSTKLTRDSSLEESYKTEKSSAPNDR
jgi:hypothetical protein